MRYFTLRRDRYIMQIYTKHMYKYYLCCSPQKTTVLILMHLKVENVFKFKSFATKDKFM